MPHLSLSGNRDYGLKAIAVPPAWYVPDIESRGFIGLALDLCICTGLQAQKGPESGLMICCHCLEINF